MRTHKVNGWLVNTGIIGDGNQRIELCHTRTIIDAIHSGALLNVPAMREPIFDLEIPTKCPGIPDDLLFTERAWSDPDDYQQAGRQLSILFSDNFAKFSGRCPPEVIAVASKITGD